MALQTIYLDTDSASQQGTYIAWFSDSDPCNDGVRFGQLTRGFVNCNEQLTLLGHLNLTFTGWNIDIHASSYPTLPTGMNDAGVPALKCVAAKSPPSAPEYYGRRFETCVRGRNEGIVSVVEFCS